MKYVVTSVWKHPEPIDWQEMRQRMSNAKENPHIKTPLFEVADLTDGLLNRNADLILANIQTDVLRDFSEKILNLVQSKGILILSGILTKEVNELARHYQDAIKVLGKEAHIETKSLSEWSSITLR